MTSWTLGPHTQETLHVGVTVGLGSRLPNTSVVGLWKGFPCLGSQLEMITNGQVCPPSGRSTPGSNTNINWFPWNNFGPQETGKREG